MARLCKDGGDRERGHGVDVGGRAWGQERMRQGTSNDIICIPANFTPWQAQKRSPLKCIAAQRRALQRSAANSSAVQCSAVQCSAVQRSK